MRCSKPSGSIYDIGPKMNFREVFGDDVWLWALPVFTSKGDGFTFPRPSNDDDDDSMEIVVYSDSDDGEEDQSNDDDDDQDGNANNRRRTKEQPVVTGKLNIH